MSPLFLSANFYRQAFHPTFRGQESWRCLCGELRRRWACQAAPWGAMKVISVSYLDIGPDRVAS